MISGTRKEEHNARLCAISGLRCGLLAMTHPAFFHIRMKDVPTLTIHSFSRSTWQINAIRD